MVSQISSVPLMFSIGGVTGVKGDASSPPGDSCTKDADKDREEGKREAETRGCFRTVRHYVDDWGLGGGGVR